MSSTMIGIRPGHGATGLKWGSREYNAPDRRFIDCDYTDIPKEHGLYVSNSGDTLLERCTFLRTGSQGAQWAHRPLPYQQYHADNAPYQRPPNHVVRDCHFVDCAFQGDRPSFNLTYFSPGTSENPGSLLIEECCFIARNHSQNSVSIDRLSGPAKILNGTKSQRLILRNNLAKNVVVRLGLGDGTRNAKVIAIPLHTPGEEVVYNAVTGEEVSRQGGASHED